MPIFFSIHARILPVRLSLLSPALNYIAKRPSFPRTHDSLLFQLSESIKLVCFLFPFRNTFISVYEGRSRKVARFYIFQLSPRTSFPEFEIFFAFSRTCNYDDTFRRSWLYVRVVPILLPNLFIFRLLRFFFFFFNRIREHARDPYELPEAPVLERVTHRLIDFRFFLLSPSLFSPIYLPSISGANRIWSISLRYF